MDDDADLVHERGTLPMRQIGLAVLLVAMMVLVPAAVFGYVFFAGAAADRQSLADELSAVEGVTVVEVLEATRANAYDQVVVYFDDDPTRVAHVGGADSPVFYRVGAFELFTRRTIGGDLRELPGVDFSPLGPLDGKIPTIRDVADLRVHFDDVVAHLETLPTAPTGNAGADGVTFVLRRITTD
ncbi:MAG: hypothetical protein AAF561_03895 [Planctomycetota bacterium]